MDPRMDNDPNPQNSFNQQPQTPPVPSFSTNSNEDLPRPMMQTPPPKKSMSRGMKTIFVVIAALAVILGGGYGAYALWYNQPKKVTDDALRSALSASSAGFSGKIEYTPANSGSGSMLTVDYDGQADRDNAQLNMKMNLNFAPVNINFGTGFISTKAGDLYIKIDHAKDILNTYAGFLGTTMDADPTLKKIGNEVDDKWIKLTAADLKEINSSGDDQQTTCIQKAVTGFQNNKSEQQQLFKLFNDNRFISIDKQLGTTKINGRMSQGYQLGFDDKKAESFAKATEQLEVIKALNKCVGDKTSDDTSNSATSAKADATIELWADQWDHTLTRVKIASNNKDSGSLSFSFDPQFNKVVKVEAPTTNVTQFKDLKKDFESLIPTSPTLPTEDLTSDFSSDFGPLEN